MAACCSHATSNQHETCGPDAVRPGVDTDDREISPKHGILDVSICDLAFCVIPKSEDPYTRPRESSLAFGTRPGSFILRAAHMLAPAFGH